MQDRMPANQVSNFTISVFCKMENPDFCFLQSGKSIFFPKKWSKLDEISSVWDEKKTSKGAAPRGIDWTPLFETENE